MFIVYKSYIIEVVWTKSVMPYLSEVANVVNDVPLAEAETSQPGSNPMTLEV